MRISVTLVTVDQCVAVSFLPAFNFLYPFTSTIPVIVAGHKTAAKLTNNTDKIPYFPPRFSNHNPSAIVIKKTIIVYMPIATDCVCVNSKCIFPFPRIVSLFYTLWVNLKTFKTDSIKREIFYKLSRLLGILVKILNCATQCSREHGGINQIFVKGAVTFTTQLWHIGNICKK